VDQDRGYRSGTDYEALYLGLPPAVVPAPVARSANSRARRASTIAMASRALQHTSNTITGGEC
jgi:hypothetical protein